MSHYDCIKAREVRGHESTREALHHRHHSLIHVSFLVSVATQNSDNVIARTPNANLVDSDAKNNEPISEHQNHQYSHDLPIARNLNWSTPS